MFDTIMPCALQEVLSTPSVPVAGTAINLRLGSFASVASRIGTLFGRAIVAFWRRSPLSFFLCFGVRLLCGSGAESHHQKVGPPMAAAAAASRSRDEARHARRGASVVEDALRVQLGEMFLLRRLLFLGHDGRTEICLGGGDAAAELNADSDIAHCHFHPGQCAEDHEVVEIAA